ncbi:hypothetical protein [Streptomyces sp. NPDC090025]|uniref:hypothetical protein n=1 Tax=Streptomyces sp. NPDC090025 TaxID=3365922 RepID=UPI0038383C5E
MIVLQPVLELSDTGGFDLWPVADFEAYDFLALGGGLSPAEVGAAVMCVAAYNRSDEPDPADATADPVGRFLHGLLTAPAPAASGGLRAIDTSTGAVLVPGCCNWLGERRDWLGVIDGDGWASFGHHPSPLAERVGGLVRLTPDIDRPGTPVLELPVTDLPALLTAAEHDIRAFLDLTTTWSTTHLPTHTPALRTALAQALAVPVAQTAG